MKRLDITYFDQLFELMEEAFPLCERRTYDEQKKLFLRKDYHVYGLLEENDVIAFIAVFETANLHFVEHLATSVKYRGAGLGRKLLETYIKGSEKTVILEVEHPNHDLAKRRIHFYERIGFTLYEVDYVQPPFHSFEQPLPLYLMSWPKRLNNEQLQTCIHEMYQEVYHWSRT